MRYSFKMVPKDKLIEISKRGRANSKAGFESNNERAKEAGRLGGLTAQRRKRIKKLLELRNKN